MKGKAGGFHGTSYITADNFLVAHKKSCMNGRPGVVLLRNCFYTEFKFIIMNSLQPENNFFFLPSFCSYLVLSFFYFYLFFFFLM